jgi:hypothetical protein
VTKEQKPVGGSLSWSLSTSNMRKPSQENTSLEMGIQSRNELILEIAAEVELERVGEDDNKDDSDKKDAPTAPVATVVPAAALVVAPEVDAKEEEDPEMLISK